MGYNEHKYASPACITTGVLIVSDSRTASTDESGRLICGLLQDNGHRVAAFNLVKNHGPSIFDNINKYVAALEIQAVICSGGTGLSQRDITVETVTPVLQKTMDGFGELFRHLSYSQIGTGCIMSRAVAGVRDGKVIICLPGSVKAVKLAMEAIILPELGHMVKEASR